MKNINITLEDWEYNKLAERKGELSWHNFIMLLAEMKI